MIEAFRVKQLILFALMAFFSYVVYERYFSDSNEQKYQPFTKGYALSGVVIKSTDESGQIITTIESPAITFYADSEKTIIEKPRVILHDNQAGWVFESESGEINPGRTEIFFPHAVEINLEDSTVEPVNIRTKALTVDVNTKTGRTADLLTVIEPTVLLRGMGAVVNFINQEVEILSEMYAEFEN